MRQAIRAVRDACDLPLVAQMTISDDGNTSFGTTPEVFASRLDEWGADVIGLNCGVGPRHPVLTAVEKMRASPAQALRAAQRRFPRDVQGRQFYMSSPEYMAKYAKRLIQAGAKFIGGCCGTTPAHIKVISDAVRAVSPRRAATRASCSAPSRVEELSRPTSASRRSKSVELGAQISRGEFVTTVEVLPPKGCDADKTLDSIRLLKTPASTPSTSPTAPAHRRA
jgi:homocysteine S-methyltransferase